MSAPVSSCNEPNHHDQAIAILQHTDDGNRLSSQDLALLEAVVNGGLEALTPSGLQYWNALHAKATKGEYVLPWLHDQQHLTKDQEGYVYWKGIKIEHYSFADRTAEAIAARELARVCRTVESRGQAMTWASCSQVYDEAAFGQGMSSPRFHVFWAFSENRHDLTVFRELSSDRKEASIAASDHGRFLRNDWGTPEGALRKHLVVSQESLEQCRRNIRSDAAWARSVLGSTVQQCLSVEEKLNQHMFSLMGDVALPSQRTLSEYVLIKAPQECEDNQEPNSPSF